MLLFPTNHHSLMALFFLLYHLLEYNEYTISHLISLFHYFLYMEINVLKLIHSDIITNSIYFHLTPIQLIKTISKQIIKSINLNSMNKYPLYS